MRKCFVLILIVSLGCNRLHNTNTEESVPLNLSALPVNRDTLWPATEHPAKSASGKEDTVKQKNILYTGPATIVYKTKAEYYDKVPVAMNDDKTKIISYPAPGDIYLNGKLSYPTKLSNGYLLDNRGINKNVVFLKLTYAEYSKLKQAPSTGEMMNEIADKNPLLEMYNLGNRSQYKNIPADLNKIIENKQLNQFKKLY